MPPDWSRALGIALDLAVVLVTIGLVAFGIFAAWMLALAVRTPRRQWPSHHGDIVKTAQSTRAHPPLDPDAVSTWRSNCAAAYDRIAVLERKATESGGLTTDEFDEWRNLKIYVTVPLSAWIERHLETIEWTTTKP